MCRYAQCQKVMKTINLLPKFDYGNSFLDKEVFELFYLIICKFKRAL